MHEMHEITPEALLVAIVEQSMPSNTEGIIYSLK
jgi:hypothetical protein